VGYFQKGPMMNADTPPNGTASPESRLSKLEDQAAETDRLWGLTLQIDGRLQDLAARFEAHAEQEESRFAKTQTSLDTLSSELHKLGAIPAALFPNLLAQGVEQNGPTAPGALSASAIAALLWFVLPKVTGWLRAKGAP